MDVPIIVSVALLTYLFLFCKIFVNPLMDQYASQMLKRQGMFVVLVIMTAWIIREYYLFDQALKAMFISVSVVLFIQFVTNISDLQFLNIASIMKGTGRTRGNFGFGHYNTLGGLCVYNIFVGLLIKKRAQRRMKFDVIIGFSIALSVLMMLVSASRSSLSGLLIYICLYFYLNIESKKLGRRSLNFIKILIVCVIVLFIAFNLNVSYEYLLTESNRVALFDVSLPVFFKSGREWIGLGYVPPEAYGMGLTPYNTNWLDNGYIYTLVATGYIGCAIYLIAIVTIAIKIYKQSRSKIGSNMICIFVVYLYTALFETTLFMGTIPNYICVILILVYTSDSYVKKEKVANSYLKDNDLCI